MLKIELYESDSDGWSTLQWSEFPSVDDILYFVEDELFEDLGIDFPMSRLDPDGAVRLAELANACAKETYRYDLKVAAFVAATLIEGVEYGWGSDGCFFIQGPCGPPASAHDPFRQLEKALAANNPTANQSRWVEPWDGIPRQPYALLLAEQFDKLRSTLLRRYHH